MSAACSSPTTCEGVLPAYLRFLRGVVDTEDLPLNISREMLQHNPLLAKIRQGVIKRVLGDLAKKAEKRAGRLRRVLGELRRGAEGRPVRGLTSNREPLVEPAAFPHHRCRAGLRVLDDYVGRMKPGAGGDLLHLRRQTSRRCGSSPQIEGFKARGVEVLLLTDPVDEFWIPAVGKYKEKTFKSVTRGSAPIWPASQA